MKYRLMIPENIKGLIEKAQFYRSIDGDILVEEEGSLYLWEEAANRKIGWKKEEIPEDWLIEVKETAFQKWLKSEPFLERIKPEFIGELKGAWNAAIDTLIDHFQERFSPSLGSWRKEIEQFKEK